MFFKTKLCTLLFALLFCVSFLFAQSTKKNKNEKKIFEVTEENYQFFLKKHSFVLFYFYSSKNAESLKMKETLKKTKINQNPALFAVNIDTNLGLRRTFAVIQLPSIVLLKKRKVIYGLSGFVDDADVLTQFINTGIKNNDFQQ